MVRGVLFFCLSLLVILSLNTYGYSKPSYWFDNGGVAVDPQNATDSDIGSFALISSGLGNLTYYGFSAENHSIINISVTYDLAVSGFLDDEWAVGWSARNATADYFLEPFGSSSRPRSSTTKLLSSPDGRWFPENVSNISVSFLVRNFSSVDAANLSLYDLYLSVAYDLEGPSIVLIAPGNDSLSLSPEVNFSFVPSDQSNISNCSLFIDGLINQTNSSVISGSETNFSVVFPDGIYNWFVECWDNGSRPVNNFSESRILRVDLAPPEVYLVSPGNATPINGSPVSLEYNFSDSSLSASCTLFIDGVLNQTEPSWPGVIQEFLLYADSGVYDWFVNCTDAAGRSNSSELWVLNVSQNEPPVISELVVDQNISLVVGSNTLISCNGSATDSSSSEISSASAEFRLIGYSGSDDSFLFVNSSCDVLPHNSTSREVVCYFSLPSYTRSGLWSCTVNVSDSGGALGQGAVDSFVEPLYAFDISPAFISYGGYEPGQTSDDESVTITNIGNVPFDIAVDGFGVVDGDGLAMNCSVGSIPLDYHRYSLFSGTSFDLMTLLTDSPVQIQDFNLAPGNSSFNSSKPVFWKVRLPSLLNGTCSGFVTFTAVPS